MVKRFYCDVIKLSLIIELGNHNVVKLDKLSFTAQSSPSQLEHKNYIWHGIKKLLDGMTKDEVKAGNQTLINFSSSIDKKNDTYIAIYTSSYFMEGQKVSPFRY